LQPGLVFSGSKAPLPDDAERRTANRLATEQEKQKKDAKKEKKAERQ
jgi:hypothetical protein